MRLLHRAGGRQAGVGLSHSRGFLDGTEVVTVEHLAAPGKLDPVQQAFIECGAFQCGYCTPGFVLMAKALLGNIPIRTTSRSGTTCPAIYAAVPPIQRS